MIRIFRCIVVAFCLSIVTHQVSWGQQPAPLPTPPPMAGAGHFSEEVFNMLFSHPIDDSERVRESIKRAVTSGESQLEGRVTIDVMPDDSRGRIDFLLRGKLNIPHATAIQRQVRVHTHVQSRVDARKSVFFDQAGLEGLSATARCPTEVQIRDVQANRRLIERMANRRAHRQLSEVEGIVAQRTSGRIQARLDERIGAAVESFEARLAETLRFEEADFEMFPPEVSFKSTDRHLQLWIAPQAGTVVQDPVDASSLDPSFDIHVLAHQQVFSGFAAYRMAGRRVHDHEVLKLVEMLRGNAPWTLWVHSRRPRWSVKLASPQPLDMRIADGNFYASIALDEFQYGADVLQGPMHVELTLRPEIAADGPRLHRLAGPEVRLHRAARPSAGVDSSRDADQTPDGRLVDLLRQKFDGMFPEYTYFDRMQPPAGGSWDKVRSLTLQRLKAEHERFEIGFQFQAEPTPASVAHTD